MFVFLCAMYCQVLLTGLNLSDISGLMKLSCFEDVAIKDSDFIYIKVAIQGVPGGMDKTSGECSLC